MHVNGSEQKPDRPFYRHSLSGVTPDCYAGRKEYKNKRKNFEKYISDRYNVKLKNNERRNIVGLKA